MTNSAPRKVLHIVGTLNRGGVETWLMNVVRSIDPARIRFDFVTHSDAPAAYDDEVRALGLGIYPCTGYRNPIRYARELRAVFKAHGPYDVVHSHVHHFSGVVVREAASAGVPVRIAHSHNDTSAVDRNAPLPRRAYLALMRRWIDRHATHLVACSGVAGTSLFGARWAGGPRSALLPYGIDLDPFAAAQGRARLAADLGLPPASPVMAHVGRFAPQKNHRRVIEIAAEVIRQIPDARLILVGEGPLRGEMEQYVRELGIGPNVTFAGIRADVAKLMSGLIDVLLFPSLHEGLPVTVIEAQAAGLPVVMSDVISPEVVAMKGRVTQLPLSAPTGAWVTAVAEWLRRREEPRPSAPDRRAALRDFDVGENIKRLEDLYSGSLSRNCHAATH